jgi:hypothetical protein
MISIEELACLLTRIAEKDNKDFTMEDSYVIFASLANPSALLSFACSSIYDNIKDGRTSISEVMLTLNDLQNKCEGKI